MPSANDDSESPPGPSTTEYVPKFKPLSEEAKANLRRDMPGILEQMRQTGELPPNPDHLTQSEQEQLRRIGHEQSSYGKKAFGHLREGRANSLTDGASDSVSGMLTKSEIEQLRRVGQQQSAAARKAFAHLRPKDSAEPSALPDVPASDKLTKSEIEELRAEKHALSDYGRKAFAHLREARAKSSTDPGPTQQSTSNRSASADISTTPPDMLTPDEIEELRRIQKEQSAVAQKAFAHLRPKKNP